MPNLYNIDAINEALREIPKEERVNLDQYRNAAKSVMGNFTRRVPNDEVLGALLSSTVNSGTALIPDEESNKRRERSALSATAWEVMFVVLAERNNIQRPDGLSSYLEPLLRKGDTSGNAFLAKQEQKKEFRDLAQKYDEYLKKLTANYDPEEMLGWSDGALVENTFFGDNVRSFEGLYRLYTAARDAEQLLEEKEGINRYLSEESRECLKRLSDDLPVLSELLARYEMICHPYYEKIDFKKLVNEGEILTKANNAVNRLGEDSNEAGYLKQVAELSRRMNQVQEWRLTNELQKNGFDLSSLTIRDMRLKDYPLNAADGPQLRDLKEDDYIICRDNVGHIMAFRPDGEKFAPVEAKYLIDNVLRDSMTTQMDKLLELTTGDVADPFWMVTGSAEYRNLKAAQAAYNKVRKATSHPPKEEELGALSESLDAMEAAAVAYLQYKDPETANVSFSEYMERKGNSLNLNEREKARLQAAFTTRDLARVTRSTLATSHDLGMKNTQVMAVDNTFYQGLLRRYDAAQKELDQKMNEGGDDFAMEVATLLDDPNMLQDDAAPYPDNRTAVLLWEMRQMTDLIERTEVAMGLRMQERAIDPKEKARAENVRKLGGTDVASFSVDALRKQLEGSLEAATKGQDQLQNEVSLTLDYSPTEFVASETLMNSRIARSNSSQEVKEYLEEEKATLESKDNALLQHRIKGLERIEELERNNPSHPPKTGYTAERNGQPVVGEPQMGDKIMLPGVHERRSQNTMNGCWSVSLCSQMEYRGVYLPQEYIRSYRPSEAENDMGSDEPVQYYSNRKQVIADYSALVNRVLPNSALFQSGFMWNRNNPESVEKYKTIIKEMVFHALTKDNSPVSICAGGHYMTIVGMEGDKVFLKNPMRVPGIGNPEGIDTWTIDELMKKGKGQLEINWLSDVTPTLGGSVASDKCWWQKEGEFYGNGRFHSNQRCEVKDPLTEKSTGLVSDCYMQLSNDAKAKVSVFTPINMKYTRLPGGCYNADALKVMENEIFGFYKSGPEGKKLPIPGAVGSVLEEMQNLQLGVRKEDPHGGMLTLAEKYLDALTAVKNAQKEKPSHEMQKLQDSLTKQLQTVRTAIFDAREADYKRMAGTGDYSEFLGGEYEKKPDFLTQRTYAACRANYLNLENSLSGMLYFDRARTFGPEDKNWINAMRTNSVTQGIAAIKDGDAFKSMMGEILEQSYDAKFYMGNSYDNYKEALSRKAGIENNKKANISRATEEAIKAYTDNLSPEAARQEMENLDKEREALIEDAGYAKDHPLRGKSVLGAYIAKLSPLRVEIREGKTAGLFARYAKHQNKVKEKAQDGPKRTTYAKANARRQEAAYAKEQAEKRQAEMEKRKAAMAQQQNSNAAPEKKQPSKAGPKAKP